MLVPAGQAAAGSGPVIDVWYGTDQYFGHIGIPQVWVNVLGKVSDSDGIQSLTYSLNGGPSFGLSIAPTNKRRIYNPGDFNVEIDNDDLINGLNTITLRAVDNLGNETIKHVNVHFESTNYWPETFSIDWSSAFDIQDVTQVVDGLWTLEADSIRPVEQGYDRLVAIGDILWQDYEITVPITIHGIDSRGYDSPSNSPAVGLVLRWQGHYAWDSSQPRWGWWPLGSIGRYRLYPPEGTGTTRLELIDNEGNWLAGVPRYLDFETPYVFKMRVETPPGEGAVYSLKVWEQGTTEPPTWDLSAQETLPDFESGSILLFSHHVDASFGDVSIISLSGTDTIPPQVTNISVVPQETTTSITWTTNEPANSQVLYGQTTSYEIGNVQDASFVTSHSVTLSGLSPDTVYHFMAISADRDGNSTASGNQTFLTLSPDNIPPSISNIRVMPGTIGATVTWTTDEPATNLVDYGPTSAYEDGVVEDGTLDTSHSITLTGLTPDSTYHYQVTSADGSGNSTTSVDLTFDTLIIPSDPSGIVSDDFSSLNLNANLWTFTDPFSLADLSMTGSQAVISLPQGLSHDPWTSNNAARIIQLCNDADFEVDVKFESEVLQKYQIQGIMVQQDNGNYLRFDVYSTGSSIRAFAGRITNSSPQGIYNRSVGSTTHTYQPVRRQGATWTSIYSSDGTTCITAGSFTDGLTPTGIGPYIGNYYPGDKAPAFTGIIDYFFNTASPIVPEDPSVGQYILTTQAIGNGTVIQVPDKMFYSAGEVVELSAFSDPGWIFSGWEGDLSGNQNPVQLTIMGDQTVTAVFGVDEDRVAPTITNIQVSPGSTGATVTWTTDEPALSRVDYGPSTAYEDGFVEDGTLVTFHSMTLTGLSPDSTYHY